MSEKKRRKAVKDWQDTPSPNPRYKGATPADVGRALLRKPARHTVEKNGTPAESVK